MQALKPFYSYPYTILISEDTLASSYFVDNDETIIVIRQAFAGTYSSSECHGAGVLSFQPFGTIVCSVHSSRKQNFVVEASTVEACRTASIEKAAVVVGRLAQSGLVEEQER